MKDEFVDVALKLRDILNRKAKTKSIEGEEINGIVLAGLA